MKTCPRILRSAAKLLALGLALWPATAAADDSRHMIKAAFIYNFARFTDWPDGSFATAGDTLRVCYRSDDPLGVALDTIAGKQVGNRAIELAPMPDPTLPPPACHIAVIPPGGIGSSQAAPHGLLTVGDLSELGDAGPAIGLIQIGRQVRFQVDTGKVERAGLHVSSKLLRLAAKVVQ